MQIQTQTEFLQKFIFLIELNCEKIPFHTKFYVTIFVQFCNSLIALNRLKVDCEIIKVKDTVIDDIISLENCVMARLMGIIIIILIYFHCNENSDLVLIYDMIVLKSFNKCYIFLKQISKQKLKITNIQIKNKQFN